MVIQINKTKKKIVSIIFGTFFLVASLSFSSALIEIDSCQELNIENEVYILQNDITGIVGTCFTIGANNVTLDFNNYIIQGDATGDGINIIGYDNTFIKNGELYNFNYGIHFNESSNNYILNTVSNNNAHIGFNFNSNSSNNTLLNITANNNGLDGIAFYYGSSYNKITNCISDDNGLRGIDMWMDIEYNKITNCILSNNGQYGILFLKSNNNHISDTVLLNPDGEDISFIDLYATNDGNIIPVLPSINNTFLNSTYVSKTICTGCELIRKEYFGNTVNFYMDLVTSYPDLDCSDGFCSTQYAGWIFIDEENNVIDSKEFEMVYGSFSDNILETPGSIGDYVLIGFITQYDQVYDLNTMEWVTSSEIIKIKEAEKIKVIVPSPVIPQKPWSIVDWFKSILDSLSEWFKGLFN